MYGKYSVFNMMNEFKENKPLIIAYLKNQSIEGLDNNHTVICNMNVGKFILLFVISLGIWIWAVFVTIKYWNMLPTCAKVIAIIGLITGVGGPLMTLIAVYIGKNNN